MEMGSTKVLCTASSSRDVPRFLRGSGQGWVTAEYGMLPSSTNVRFDREAVKGKQASRTVEIQRLIGRALRQSINLKSLGDRTIHIDCDVLEADGGTRTAAITGGCVALYECLRSIDKLEAFEGFVAAVSVGMFGEEARLDLEYIEDSKADTDMNVVMFESDGLVEIQGTGEQSPFTFEHLERMLALARDGIAELQRVQKATLNLN